MTKENLITAAVVLNIIGIVLIATNINGKSIVSKEGFDMSDLSKRGGGQLFILAGTSAMILSIIKK